MLFIERKSVMTVRNCKYARNIKKVTEKYQKENGFQNKRKRNYVRKQINTYRTEKQKKPKRLLTKQVDNKGIQVSYRTVQRRLAEVSLIARKPARKPNFIKAIIKKQLE